MKPSILPILLGWVLSVWLPVPGLIRSTAQTLIAAAFDGVSAVAHTIQTKSGGLSSAGAVLAARQPGRAR